MKKILLLFVILGITFFSGILLAQNDKVVDNDIYLTKIKTLLPADWNIYSQYNSELIIEKSGQVYELYENMINAPERIETQEGPDKRIKEKGKIAKTRFEFKIYDRLGDEKIESIKKKNDSINNVIIKKLPKKYKIENLLDKFATSKGEIIYTANTEEEKERVKAFENERNNLLDKIVKLPDYNSENYSLYFTAKSGISDEFHLISPFIASEEAYTVLNLLDEKLMKVK